MLRCSALLLQLRSTYYSLINPCCRSWRLFSLSLPASAPRMGWMKGALRSAKASWHIPVLQAKALPLIPHHGGQEGGLSAFTADMDSSYAPDTPATLSLSSWADLTHLFLPRSRLLRETSAGAEPQAVGKSQPRVLGSVPKLHPGLPDWVPHSRASSEPLHRCAQTSNSCVLNCTFNYIY